MQSDKYFNYKNLKIIILSLILVISFWRSPYIFLNGRFIDEEARKHLIYALQNPFLTNLFYYDSLAGYLNLLPNILLWAATKVRIEFAPLITVYGSFFFIILPIEALDFSNGVKSGLLCLSIGVGTVIIKIVHTLRSSKLVV